MAYGDGTDSLVQTGQCPDPVWRKWRLDHVGGYFKPPIHTAIGADATFTLTFTGTAGGPQPAQFTLAFTGAAGLVSVYTPVAVTWSFVGKAGLASGSDLTSGRYRR